MIKTLRKCAILGWLTVLISLVLVTGCKDKMGKTNTGEPTMASKVPQKNAFGWPQPDSYAKGIPVYDTFEGLEPLFRFDNDTTYVINFWATWCKPCLEELPYFEEFDANLKNERVKVVLVSLDFPKQVESKLVPFIEKQRLKSKVLVLLDGKYNDWIDKVSPSWSGAIPATYIYKGGQDNLVDIPFESMEQLAEAVKPFL